MEFPYVHTAKCAKCKECKHSSLFRCKGAYCLAYYVNHRACERCNFDSSVMCGSGFTYEKKK